MKVYLASSWKNLRQPSLLAALRAAGHDVYDFRHPTPDNHGFGWRQITEVPRPWPLGLARAVLSNPIAEEGFAHDMRALREADAGVLLLPSGSSAHLEAGFLAGAGKRVAVYCDPEVAVEPELMWKAFGHTSVLCTDETTLLALLGEWSLM